MFSTLVQDKIDILLISETKIDNTYPTSQFKINGFDPHFRKNRTEHGGGILLYVRQDIPTKQLDIQSFGEFECLTVEVNISKKSGLFVGHIIPKNH